MHKILTHSHKPGLSQLATIHLFYDVVSLLVFLASIIPTIILLRIYWVTKIEEYLYLGMTTFLGIGAYLLLLLAKLDMGSRVDMILSKIFVFALLNLALFIFLYSVKLRWNTPPKAYLMLFIIPYIVLSLLTILGKEMDQKGSDNTLFGTLSLDKDITNGSNFYYPHGFSFEVGDIIIVSSSYLYLVFIYLFLVQGQKVFMYFQSYSGKQKSVENHVRRIWIFGSTFMWLSAIFTLPGLGLPIVWWSATAIFFIILNYISIKYPDFVIVSNHQILRAVRLYDQIDVTTPKTQVFGMDKLKDYLDTIKPILEIND